MNALSLPPALRFNEPAVSDAIAALAGALGTDDPAARIEEPRPPGRLRAAA